MRSTNGKVTMQGANVKSLEHCFRNIHKTLKIFGMEHSTVYRMSWGGLIATRRTSESSERPRRTGSELELFLLHFFGRRGGAASTRVQKRSSLLPLWAQPARLPFRLNSLCIFLVYLPHAK